MTALPIDKGWAWVCCLGAAINIFIVVGGLRSVGLLFIEIVERYNASRVVTSLTVTFLAAGFAVLAPVANALGMKFTMRTVVLIGGVCTAISAFLTSFSPNVYYIIVVFGVWTGIGYGMMFGPSLVVVGMHFKERRSLANGLAAAGGSLGQLIIPQLLRILTKEYSFQGCMLIYSAVILHALPAAMLYRPLSFYLSNRPPHKDKQSSADKDTTKNVLKNSNNSESDVKSEKQRFLPEVEDVRLNKIVSKSKQSLYASTSSLYFAPHQSAPPVITDSEDHMSYPVKTDSHKQKSPNSNCGFCRIFEWSLFKNWLFVIYVAGLSCGHGGYINLCMFFPPYAADQNLDKEKVALLMSIIGISDLVGRVFGGWFADLGIMKRSNIMAVCLSFTGGCALLVPFIPRFEAFAVFSVIVGMIGGVYVSLMVVVIIDFLGLEKLATSFGLATMCMGLATIPVPLILGVIKDILGSFSPAIRICGTLMVFGGAFFMMEPVARKLQESKQVIQQDKTDDITV